MDEMGLRGGMILKQSPGALSLSLMMGVFPCFGQDVLIPVSEVPVSNELPSFDVLRLRYESQLGQGLGGSGAELDSSLTTFGGFLNEPLGIGGDWNVISYLGYRYATLDFENIPTGAPFEDEDLHRVSLHGIFFHQVAGSRWTYGVWTRANFASDGESVNGDDFFYDLAIGSAYQVSDDFVLGFGVVGLELGGDSQVLAGPFFTWRASDTVNVSLLGPLFTAKWEVSDDWSVAVRGAPYGNTWNIDAGGESNELDLSSYTLRLHAERRVVDDLWLSIGVGYSFESDFEVRDSSGSRLFKEDLTNGFSLSVGLRLKAW